MSTEIQATESSATVVNPAESSAPAETKSNSSVVSQADHKRVTEDMLKFKREAQELKAQIAEFKTQVDSAKQKAMQEQGDFKSLYEQEKARRTELDQKLAKTRDGLIYNEKFKAAQSELLKAGLRPEAIKILEREPLTEIEVETTSEGRMIPHGVDLYVEKFKSQFAFAFKQSQAAKVNGGGGGTEVLADQKLTGQSLYDLELKAKRSGKAEDKQAYTKALDKYREQKFKRG